MALGKGLRGFRAFAVALLVAAPSVAYAHALFVNPVPRDTTDTKLKMGPCGGNAAAGPNLKGQPVIQYEAGATVPILWKETVLHGGCYQIRLNSTATDTNQADYVLLGQYQDPGGGTTGSRDASVKLPDGVTCPNCTLQLLQIMRTDNTTSCPAQAQPTNIAGQQSLYFSCADVRIGDFTDAGAIKDAGPPDEDAATQDPEDGSTSNTEPSEGGKTSSSSGDATGRRTLPPVDDGCNVGFGGATGVSFFVTAGIAVMALARRRRKQK